LLCLLPSASGDKIVKVAIREHHFFTLLAAAYIHVAKLAAANEAAKRAD
jgi:hypothetical protein